jgi:(R,R)-butanediol dehydrogenase/meso-butanediol dehydrogenase/diacetyl reductase
VKALRFYGKEDLRYEDISEPSPRPGEVKVRIKWNGICGSDLHEYRFGPSFISVEPHPLTGRMVPMTIGHEYSGEVVELGEGVKDLKVGDRVTGDCNLVCGKCYYCLRNMPNLCVSTASVGFHADGSLAEYLVVPAYTLYKLPDSIPDEIGALTEPLAVGVHAVRRSMLQVGDVVVIIGAGTIGLTTLLAAKAAGAAKVYSIDISSLRGEKALTMGATAVFNPKDGNLDKQIHDITGGLGADVTFDCAGQSTTGPLAVQLTRKEGTVVIVGMSWQPSSDFRFVDVMMTEKTVLGSIGYRCDTPAVIDLIVSGRMEPSGLITGKIALRDAVDKGFKELIANPEENLKILVKP